MCGRYYIEISDAALRQIAEEVLRRVAAESEYEQLQIVFDGEVLPSNVVPVQTTDQLFQPMRWGFSGFSSKTGKATRPIINARSETVLEKSMFRSSVLERRCLIPASGYFEWQQVVGSRKKLKTRLFTGQTMYFAGCYRLERESGEGLGIGGSGSVGGFDVRGTGADGVGGGVAVPRFVILTRDASAAVAPIHDRMPVLFDKDSGQLWLSKGIEAIAQATSELQFEQID